MLLLLLLKTFLPSLFQLIPGSVFKVKRQGHLSDFALNVNETIVSLITGMNSWVFFFFFFSFLFFWGSMFHTVTLTVLHNSYRRRTLLVRPIERLRARTIPWFFGHFWKCSEVVEFWHVDTFKNGRKIKGLFLLWALQLCSHLLLTCLQLISMGFLSETAINTY